MTYALTLTFLLITSAAGKLLEPLTSKFAKTKFVLISRDEFTLPWEFSRASPAIGQLWDATTSDNATNHELSLLSRANFVAFDPEFLDIVGPDAVVEKIFNVSAGVHEAPVWLPDINQIIFTPIGENFLYNIDLNAEPPVLSNFTPSPPIGSVNGGFLHKGKIIYGTDGFKLAIPPGVYSFDPKSRKTEVLLNNYRGLRFASCDDLVVDDKGNIIFTDVPFGFYLGIIPYPPQMPPGVWSFNPETGALKVVDDSLKFPNGVALSADGKTLYVTSTPIVLEALPNLELDILAPRGIYAFDYDSKTSTLSNRRLFYVPDSYVADGIKVSDSGFLFAAAGTAIDVVRLCDGKLVGKISTGKEIMNNLVAVPGGEWWFTGQGGVWRARISEQGVLNYG